jgi:hypothetical protein
MSVGWIILIVVLVIIMVGGAPGIGPLNHNYGYWLSGGVGLVVLILIILLLLGKL